MSIASIVAAAALGLLVQDPPPGEVISTAPPPATAVDPNGARPPAASGGLVWSRTPSDPVTPEPRRFGRLGEAATAELARRDAAGEPEFEPAFGASRATSPAAATPATPLPPEALADPVRYAADQCRPQVRPAGEDVADCFDRIDRAVRAEQNARAAARRPQVRCNSSATRDDDRRTSSTSGGCSIGTGDPALLNRTLGW